MEILQILKYTLICAVPMAFLCYNLIMFGRERPDYGTYTP